MTLTVQEMEKKQETAYQRYYDLLREIRRVERGLVRRYYELRDELTGPAIDSSIFGHKRANLRDPSVSIDLEEPDISPYSNIAKLT